MSTVIILNSPPGSGKDTIADLLIEQQIVQYKCEFKQSLYEETAARFSMSPDDFKRLATDRNLNEVENDKLGCSPSEALIHVSEDVIKPCYGKDYFGIRAAERVREICSDDETVVFSDGGFVDEMIALKKGWVNVVLVRMHRDTFDFSKDSRDYVYSDELESYDVQLVDGSPQDAVNQIKNIMSERG